MDTRDFVHTDPGRLREHVFSTYINLRYGIAGIVFAFPVVVYVVGLLQGFDLQRSLSAYYWAGRDGEYWARTWFVGGLFAVAAFLYLYKGFTKAENWLLNAAALLGLGVAVIPTTAPGVRSQAFTLHGACAVALFICLACVVWFRARDTLPFLPDRSRVPRFLYVYRIVSLLMLASPLTAFALGAIFEQTGSYIFFIESAGVWAFAAYWWIKSSELAESNATRKALDGQIAVAPERKLESQPGRSARRQAT